MKCDWKIRISDGDGFWEYDLKQSQCDTLSVYDIADMVHTILECEEPLQEGKWIGPENKN